jgi:hypothetical protein
VELLVVIVIIPIVAGAISAGLVEVFSIQHSVSSRLSDSGDAQVISTNYVADVQSAAQITTDPAAVQCGPGYQLLGLEWNPDATGVDQTVVTYARVPDGSHYVLRRQYCLNGPSATYNYATTISTGVSGLQLHPVTLTPSTVNTLASEGWIPVAAVQSVKLNLIEPSSSYHVRLTAVPAASSPPSTAGSPIVNPTTTLCGFAPTQGGTVTNGTYAKTMCLVDFSSYDPSKAAAPGCQSMVASIPGGDILSFCISTSGTQPLHASALPTYPQAFLGNTINGAPFYTGIGCADSTSPVTGTGAPTPSCIKPAIYQTNTGLGPSNTIVVTDISVTTPTGAPATGWHFVSVDAETTDQNESITWTSDAPLVLLNNTPSSPYGNTCNNLPTWNGPQWTNSKQVQCVAGLQETSAIKTGTPMFDALTPTSMTITMKGAGLEGIALGLLLS